MPDTQPQLLDPQFLAKLEQLELASRKIFLGRLKGERRSKRRGQSVEFMDFRNYVVGDDLRFLDWNLFARLDRLFLRLFLEEEDLHFHILIDNSLSMDFGTPTKLDCAVRLAAALGFVGLMNLERVGVGVLRERVAEGWPPTRGRHQVNTLLNFLGGVEPVGGTGLNEALASYATRSRQAGLAVIISDLLDPAGYEAGVRALLERRFDVHLVHVLAPEEMSPEIVGDLRLLDRETGETRDLSMDGDAVRAYRERLRQFLDRAETFCRMKEIGYHRLTSDSSVEDFVLSQLRGRVVA